MMVSFDFAAKIHFFFAGLTNLRVCVIFLFLRIDFEHHQNITTMIKNSQDIRVETVENSGNIEGRISKNIILTPAEMLERASMFNIITLPSGSRIKEHPHIDDAEIYYILEGEAEVTDNGRTAIMHAGDVMFTGNGARHSIANHSGKDVRFLACILK